MCLILFKPANASFDHELLRAAQQTNPHGVGFMMPGGAGTVQAAKGLWNPEKVQQFWHKFKNRPLAVHFRMRTQGEIDVENCHPFQVLKKDRDGMDLWMMHNGTIQGIRHVESKKSDSYNFVHYELKPILAKNPRQIYDRSFQRWLSNKVGSWNKLLFMDGTGQVIIINEDQGSLVDGCWLSNTYSIRRRPSILYTYDYDEDDYYPQHESSWERDLRLQRHKKNNPPLRAEAVQRPVFPVNDPKHNIIDAVFDVIDDKPKLKWVSHFDEDGWPNGGRYVEAAEDISDVQ